MLKFLLNIVEKINIDIKEHIVKTGIIVLVLTISYLLLENIFLSFIIASAVAIIFFNWDSRVFIAFGLIFLISCPILLAMEKKTVAEEMAVYAYYMLALGVILQVIQYFKESFAKPGKPRPSVDFWGKRKVIGFVLATAVIALAVFTGSFAFLYREMHKEFASNKEHVSGLINNHLNDNKKIMDKLTDNQRKLADQIFAVRAVDWESVRVLVENTSGQSSLGDKIAKKFKDLGCANVYSNKKNFVIYDTSYVEYCPGCADITQELLAVLKNPDEVVMAEDSDLADEIRVRLGADQISVENSNIAVSILNGSDLAGAAGKLGGEMSEQEFKVVSVGDADRRDYGKTTIKYLAQTKEKAEKVKEYLMEFYNVEMIEVEEQEVDVEVVIGGE